MKYLYFYQLNGDEFPWGYPLAAPTFEAAVRAIKTVQAGQPERKGRILRATVVAVTTDLLDNVEEDEDNVPYGGRDDEDEYWEGKT